MLPDKYNKALSRARHNNKENKKFLNALSKRRNVDELFHAQHEEVFSRVDCLDCANCCKTTSPIFRDVDVERISKHFGMKASAFTEKYLHMDEDRDLVLNVAPCAFLGEDNYCSIYDVRPKACREYPHTDRKNMIGILPLTHSNTLVCPAVAEMVENIKAKMSN